jgi:DNA-directed RNA polymerase subunit RPC12/RpoP
LATTGGSQPVVPGGLKDYALLFNLAMPILALGLFFIRLHKSINESHPSQCTRCGDPFHTTDSNDPSVCSKCHHLFVLKDGLHSESRKKKVDGVADFQNSQRWIHKILMVIMPGADRCFIGDTRSGFVEFIFVCFALGIVLATGHSLRYPGEILADPASTWLPLGLVLLAVLFVRSWFKLLPRRY